MSGIALEEARALLAERDLIAVGARADEERRRRHGTRTTFVRVLDVHVEAIPARLPAGAAAGELRIVGKPASIDAAAAAVRAARSLAGTIPLTAFCLADLLDVACGTAGFHDALREIAAAGVATIAEASIDGLPDPSAAIAAARDAGLQVPRVTIRQRSQDGLLDLIARARAVQQDVGGIRVFAPLPRVSSVAQPSTGYDDVKAVAVSRLHVDNIESIQVNWSLYGPKLAQVALTMGADDVDSVSALEGELGRRRSPLEEIRGNIAAAGLDAVERRGDWIER